MKYTLLIISFLFSVAATAQGYEKQWEKVIEFEAGGLIKSATAQTDTIYTLAKKDRNEPQLLKAFFFKSKYMQTLEEDAQVKIVNALRDEIKTASVPTRAILESIYGQILSDIYSQISYKINNRTDINTTPNQDIATWTGKNFRDEIAAAYKRSLQNREVLYKTPLANYEAVINFNPITAKTNRSLYDFLAERFSNSKEYYYDSYPEREKLEPQLPFLLGDSNAFAKFKMPDSLPEEFKTRIALYRELEEFYIRKKDTYSLQNAVLERLGFVDKYVHTDAKKTITLATLQGLAKEWGNSPYGYRALLEQAKIYSSVADKKKAPDYLLKAVALCDTIIAHAAINDAAPDARNLKNALINKTLNLQTEKYIAPGNPFLGKVSFKNVNTVRVRIFKLSHKQAKAGNNENLYLTYKDSINPYIEKTYTLPGRKDLFEYTTEIILPALPKGFYLIAAAPALGAPDENSTYSADVIQASDIALTKQEMDGYTLYQVTNSTSGKPIANAKALHAGKEYASDKLGRISITGKGKRIWQELMVLHDADTLDASFYSREKYSADDNEYFTASAQLYLDRAIYRPGQTVYFKGLVTQNKNGVYSTVPNIYFTVIIEDTQNNELKTFRLQTNDFGSFTGDYTLPKNVLTGEFSIEIDEDEDAKDDDPFWDNVDFDDTRTDFSVEEYKRPTFEVTFNPVKNDIRLKEKATVTGNAKAFSGANVSGAKVVYRVTRNARMSRYFYYSENNTKEIASGEVTTDANGLFTINFIAEPDPAFAPDGLPVFTYTINAAVTDSNGETRSGSKSVYGGYHSLLLQAQIPSVINAAKPSALTIDSKNLNGEFRPVTGDIVVYKLVDETKVTSERPWPEPEIQQIPREEFEKTFPYLPYRSKTRDTIIRQTAVLTQKVNTATGKSIALANLKEWPSGRYQAVFTAKDSLNNTVEATALFTLKRNDDKQVTGNNAFVFDAKNENYTKDGFIELELRSPLPLLYINIQAYNKNNKLYDNVVTLTGGRQIIKVPVPKKATKAIHINMDFIWQNHFYTRNAEFEITAKHNSLTIETQTLTNKLLPGSSQTWSFSIKDSNKAPAEVLASMYDTSLDLFKREDWRLPDESNPYDNYRIPYKDMETDGTSYSRFYSRLPNVISPFTDDALYTFGFEINRIGNLYWAQTPKRQLPGSRAYTISGVVTDASGMTLPGVNVTLKGTTEGTQTDFDGNYTIYASKGDSIMYSFVAMETKYVTVDMSGTLNIQMKGVILNDVVVEAYRTTTRAQSNVALTTVTSKTIEGRGNANYIETLQGQVPGLQISNGSGQPGGNSSVILRGYGSVNGNVEPLYVIDGVPLTANEMRNLDPNSITSMSILKDAGATALYGSRGANGVIIIKTKEGENELKALQQVKARKNFNETAFFYPQLRTDKEGRISFTFTTPEALTEWRLRLLAHNKKAVTGYLENTFVTQKDLMVVPNMPRFLREKDTVVIAAKITNMTADAKNGTALLQLFDAVTMQPADAQMLNIENVKPFTLTAKGSSTVTWKIAVPAGMQGVQYKILAKAGDFTDGEENILPVLTNSMLVTESIPVWVKPNTTKTYTFENLKNNISATLRHQGITLEYTSNPAWVALQSLPYLMEFEHECAEQVFSRFYANAIAAHIINSNPKIAGVFAAWRATGKPLNKLEQNEELKNIILAESPWMLDAENDEEKKNRLALLFDLDKMKLGLTANLDKLAQKQSATGGFPWFEGGEDSEYITRHILAGFGHLAKLGITSSDKVKAELITKRAIAFTDTKFEARYKKDAAQRKKQKKGFTNTQSYTDLHYLYTRSYYLKQYPLTDSLSSAVKLYVTILKKDWLTYSLYEKGMAALTLHRFGDTVTAKKIVASLKETSSNNEDWGMYWIANKPGWYWYRAPIETQALLIEAFTEVAGDTQSADAMKVWLIKNKQNKNWPTTKSTSEAVYALLMQGTDWLSVKDNTTITLGDDKLLAKKMAENAPEAATGYIKLNWQPNEVTKGMATLTVENKSAVPGFGGFYWQYFEELDKIKPAQAGIMNITKELYFRGEMGNAPPLQLVTKNTPLKIGSLVTVRLVLNIKEDVEFVHLKDLRAAAFEPVDVLSGYEHKDGLGYYKSTRDVATHFFFDHINRGTYVLEYQVRVNNAGEFSNGITTIESMYAPEFSGHSVGTRVRTGE